MKASEYDTLLKDMEVRLEKIRALYEQYFLGLERIAPEKQRDDFDRALKALRREQPRNTALRFRTQNLVQRYVTLSTHWARIVRQIEEGTYKRDVQRAHRRRAQTAAEKAGPQAYELDLDVEVDMDELFGEGDVDAALSALELEPAPVRAKIVIEPKRDSMPASFGRPAGVRAPTVVARVTDPGAPTSGPPTASVPTTSYRPPSPAALASSRPPARPAAPPAPRPVAAPPVRPAPGAPPVRPAPPPPRPSAALGIGDAQLRELYDRYVDARRRNNERVDNVKFESLAKSIDEMAPKLQQKHQGKKIDFEVVVKDGRVGLKPVPKG